MHGRSSSATYVPRLTILQPVGLVADQQVAAVRLLEQSAVEAERVVRYDEHGVRGARMEERMDGIDDVASAALTDGDCTHSVVQPFLQLVLPVAYQRCGGDDAHAACGRFALLEALGEKRVEQ